MLACVLSASGFHLIVCGLDSILARRWLNGMLVSLLEYDEDNQLDPSSIVPMVDGGTEGTSVVHQYVYCIVERIHRRKFHDFALKQAFCDINFALWFDVSTCKDFTNTLSPNHKKSKF